MELTLYKTMEIKLITIHIGLSVLLFFLSNWIGKHSTHAGYIKMSVLLKADEAPLFNFLYRSFFPIVFLIICSAFFYKINQKWIINRIYLVVVYYFLFRLVFNLLTGKGRLLNWYRQFAYWIISIPSAYYIYDRLILQQEFFLPTKKELSSALWLAILAYIYHTFNSIRLSDEKAKQRKINYIKNRYYRYKKLYDDIIYSIAQNKQQEALIYTILIYEAFNRPKIFRLIENLLFKVGVSKTLGIMQVTTDQKISDRESVKLGAEKIVKDHLRAQTDTTSGISMYPLWRIRKEVIALYNRDDDYVNEVNLLYDEIVKQFYNEYKDDW